jgi:hypothetical protein
MLPQKLVFEISGNKSSWSASGRWIDATEGKQKQTERAQGSVRKRRICPRSSDLTWLKLTPGSGNAPRCLSQQNLRRSFALAVKLTNAMPVQWKDYPCNGKALWYIGILQKRATERLSSASVKTNSVQWKVGLHTCKYPLALLQSQDSQFTQA